MLLVEISTVTALVLHVQVGDQTHEFNLIWLLFQFIEGPRPGDRTGTASSSQQEAWPAYSIYSLF